MTKLDKSNIIKDIIKQLQLEGFDREQITEIMKYGVLYLNDKNDRVRVREMIDTYHITQKDITRFFDKDEEIIGKKINNIPVYDINTLEKYLNENDIDIVVFAIPAVGVRNIIDIVINSSIKGIWNFSYLDLKVPPHIAMVNMHLSDSLMTLSYKISKIHEQSKKK